MTLGFTPETGIFLMYYSLITIVACDAGAYFAGPRLGPPAARAGDQPEQERRGCARRRS